MATPRTSPPREWTPRDLEDLGRRERGRADYLKAVPVLFLETWVLENRVKGSANFVRTDDLAERLEGCGLKSFKLKGRGQLFGAPTTIQNSRNLSPPLFEKGDRGGEFWITLPHYERLLQEYCHWYREHYPEDYEKLFPDGGPCDEPLEEPAKRRRESGSLKAATTEEEKPPGLSELEPPSMHIDIQIHISPEADADQIDQIFASMAKHLGTLKTK